jgi:hypothetical protein
MNTRRRVRTLAIASTLAFIVLSAPSLERLASAEENHCTPSTCGTEECSYNGKKYGGGETIYRVVNTPKGPVGAWFVCNGFTGKWELVGTVPVRR